MFCEHCGNKLSDDALFCARCGRRIAWQQQTPPPPPPPQRGSPAPFVMILVAYGFWFVWHEFLLECVTCTYGYQTYILLSHFEGSATSLGLFGLAWLAGLAAILLLAQQKKISSGAFSWKDAVSAAVLSVAAPLLPIATQYCFVSQYGEMGRFAYAIFKDIEKYPILNILYILGIGLACVIFMRARSGTLRVTRNKALICLAVLLGFSLLVSLFCGILLPSYVEQFFIMSPWDITAIASKLLCTYALFLWVKWMVLFWLAADSGGGWLPCWGRLMFTAVLMAFGLIFWPAFLLHFLHLGETGAALTIPAVYLTAAAVLLVNRLIRAARRQRQPSDLNLL